MASDWGRDRMRKTRSSHKCCLMGNAHAHKHSWLPTVDDNTAAHIPNGICTSSHRISTLEYLVLAGGLCRCNHAPEIVFPRAILLKNSNAL